MVEAVIVPDDWMPDKDPLGLWSKPASVSQPRAATAPAGGRDMDDIIDTVISEAGGEGPEGMQGVANVIKNRAARRGQSPSQVVRAPHQFAGYESPPAATLKMRQDPNVRSEAARIVNGVFSGELPDVTGGADHFHSGPAPDWAGKMARTTQIGGHMFYASTGESAPEAAPDRTTVTAAMPRGAIKLSFAHKGQEDIDPGFRGVLEGAGSAAGLPVLNITSGYRSPQHKIEAAKKQPGEHSHRTAADIDMSGMSIPQRQQLIAELQSRGAKRFIAYSGSPNMLHVDMKDQRGDGLPYFMFDKSAANMDRAPDWFKQVARSEYRPVAGGGAGSKGVVTVPDDWTPEPEADPMGLWPEAAPAPREMPKPIQQPAPTQPAQPAAQPAEAEAPAPEAPAEPGLWNDLKQGFISGAYQNPEMTGAAMQGLADLIAPDEPASGVSAVSGGDRLGMIQQTLADMLRSKGAEIREFGAAGVQEPRVPDLEHIQSVSDAFSYAASMLGQGVGTSVPSLAAGGAVAVAGGGPLGVGAAAFGPSYVQNFGDAYQTLTTDKNVQTAIEAGKITKKQVAQLAAEFAVPMGALDAAGSLPFLGKGFMGKWKGNLFKRMLKNAAQGIVSEGTTEGAQQALQETALETAGGKKTLAEQAMSVVNAVAAGAIAGGGMGAATPGGAEVTIPSNPEKEKAKAGSGERQKGTLEKALEHGDEELSKKHGVEVTVEDPAFVGRDGTPYPAHPLHGEKVKIDPDQTGVPETMRRVVLPNGRKAVIGNKLIKTEPEKLRAEVNRPAEGPKQGTRVRVFNEAAGIDYVATIEGYTEEGEAEVSDPETGEVMAVPMESIQPLTGVDAIEPPSVPASVRGEGGVLATPGPPGGGEPPAGAGGAPVAEGDMPPPAEPIEGKTTTVLPAKEAQKPALDRFPGPPPAGASVIVHDEESGQRFAGKIQSYEEDGKEAVIRKADGSIAQVPVDRLFIDKSTKKEVEAARLKAEPPVERAKAEGDNVRHVMTPAKKTAAVEFPDAVHTRLFELGKLRQGAKVLGKTSHLDLENANPTEHQDLAKELGISTIDLGTFADDYRYRAERAAASSRSQSAQKMHKIDAKKLAQAQRRQAQTVANEAKFAARAVPAVEVAVAAPARASEPAAAPKPSRAFTDMGPWYDGLSTAQRKQVLDDAKVRRAPHAYWAKLPIDAQTKIYDSEGAKEAAALTSQIEAEFEAGLAPVAAPAAEPEPAETVDHAAHQAATSSENDTAPPTPAQRAAGNYQKGHTRIGGMPISIENPEDSVRSSKPGQPRWTRRMKDAHYGHILGTKGNDGQPIDVFIAPGTELNVIDDDSPVFIINQQNADKTFDEHKVMVGYEGGESDATKAYLANYPKTWTGLQSTVETTVGDLKAWLKHGDMSKPASQRGVNDAVEVDYVSKLSPEKKAEDDIFWATNQIARGIDVAANEKLLADSLAALPAKRRKDVKDKAVAQANKTIAIDAEILRKRAAAAAPEPEAAAQPKPKKEAKAQPEPVVDEAMAEIHRENARLEAAVTPIDPANVPSPVNDKPLAADPENTLVLMACSDDKIDPSGRPGGVAPLYELYNGPFWQSLRKHGGALLKNVYVLSGKWGFTSAGANHKGYDEKISKKKVDELIERGIFEGGKAKAGTMPMYSSPYSQVHRSVWVGPKDTGDYTHPPYKQVIIHAPGLYQGAFNAIVTQLQQAGVIEPGAPIRATSGDLIKRRKQFGQMLRDVTGVEAEAAPVPDAEARSKAVATIDHATSAIGFINDNIAEAERGELVPPAATYKQPTKEARQAAFIADMRSMVAGHEKDIVDRLALLPEAEHATIKAEAVEKAVAKRAQRAAERAAKEKPAPAPAAKPAERTLGTATADFRLPYNRIIEGQFSDKAIAAELPALLQFLVDAEAFPDLATRNKKLLHQIRTDWIPRAEKIRGKVKLTEIGKNTAGQTVSEDYRGTRSFVGENRRTQVEPVALHPETGLQHLHHHRPPEFRVVGEEGAGLPLPPEPELKTSGAQPAPKPVKRLKMTEEQAVTELARAAHTIATSNDYIAATKPTGTALEAIQKRIAEMEKKIVDTLDAFPPDRQFDLKDQAKVQVDVQLVRDEAKRKAAERSLAEAEAKEAAAPAAAPEPAATPAARRSAAEDARGAAVAELHALADTAQAAGRTEKPWREAMREAMRKSAYGIRVTEDKDGNKVESGSGVEFRKGWVDGLRDEKPSSSASKARFDGYYAGRKWIEANPTRTDTVRWELKVGSSRGHTTIFNVGDDAETIREFAGRVQKLALAHFVEPTNVRAAKVAAPATAAAQPSPAVGQPAGQPGQGGKRPVGTKGGVKPTKAKPADRAAQLSDYFAPGNIVKSYGGHDRVIAFDIDAHGRLLVTVRSVVKTKDGWIDNPTDNRIRQHGTQPSANELRAGPVQRAKPLEALRQDRPRKVRRDTKPDRSRKIDGYRDHGIDNLTFTGPAGEGARQTVLERGRNGHEHMVVIDVHGDVVGNGEGGANSTGMSQRLFDLMTDPGERLVVHHNHPSGSEPGDYPVGFSNQDIMAGRHHGVVAVYAHNVETSYRLAWLPNAREAFELSSGADVTRALAAAMKPINDALEALFRRGAKTHEEVNREVSHLRGMAARDAGWIEYTAEDKPDLDYLSIPSLKAAYDQAVADLAEYLEGNPDGELAGRAGAVRHPGEIEGFHQGDEGIPAPAAAQSGDQARTGQSAAAAEEGLSQEDDFDRMLREAKERIAAREATLAALVAGGPRSIRFIDPRDPNRRALVGPDMSIPGSYRITRFDALGPFGHGEYPTFEKAVEAALQEKFVPQQTSEALRQDDEEIPFPLPQPGPVARTRTGPAVFLDPEGRRVAVTPTGARNRITVRDVATAFDREHKRRFRGRKLFPERDRADYRRLVDMARQEMRLQLPRENSGVGWYDQDVELALNLTSRIFPSLATEPSHVELFLTFAGIFSTGTNPEHAWMASAEAFAAFEATGQIPVVRADALRAAGKPVVMTTFTSDATGEEVTRPAGWGTRNAGNEQQLRLLNHIVQREGGLREGLEWLLTPHPRAEINRTMTEFGYKVVRFETRRELAGPPVEGVLVFGEKLGRYMLGLQGMAEDQGDTTVDLWFTRTFRRLTGRLFDPPIGDEGIAAQPAGDLERDAYFRLTGDLAREFNLSTGDVQAVLWFFEKRLWGAHGLPTQEGTSSSGARRLLRSRTDDLGEGSRTSGVPAVPAPALRTRRRGEGEARSLEGLSQDRGEISRSAAPPTRRRLIDMLRDRLTDLKPSLMATIPLNYFPELAPKPIRADVRGYLNDKRDLDAYKGNFHGKADDIVQAWRRIAKLGRKVVGEMHDLMADSTLAGLDPTQETRSNVDNQEWQFLRQRLMRLPQVARDHFEVVRDAYRDKADETDRLILKNIRDAIAIAERKLDRQYFKDRDKINKSDRTPQEKQIELERLRRAHAKAVTQARWAGKARLSRLRKIFEGNKVKEPYFPLGRFGQYFVEVRDGQGDVVSFSRRERKGAARQVMREMQAKYAGREGFKVRSGKLASNDSARDRMPAALVGEIQAILSKAGVDQSVQDQIWQRYLETLPDLSMRKSQMNRRGVPGFDRDALRVFASQMFHAGHQLARLAYGQRLGEHIDKARDEVRDMEGNTDEAIRSTIMLDELNKRHAWVMNPGGSAAANYLKSLAFVWYLGLTPAAAMVNLSQTFMMGVPVLWGRFGSLPNATAQLARATRNVFSDKGLSVDEKKAMDAAHDSGLVTRSQSHDIASVGEEGLQFHPGWAKAMRTVSWLFHQAELANRRVTFLAAYRMAIAKGQRQEEAVDTAHDLTYRIHFDYSNTSRPRFLQTNFMNVAGTFKAYQLNMFYRIFRDFHQSIKGETPQAKAEARRQLVGVLGMQALLAGTVGVFGFNLLMSMLTAIDAPDEDDPLDYDTKYRSWIMELFGPHLGGVILNGVPGSYAGVDLSTRIGMPDMIFQVSDQDKEGDEEFYFYLMQALGVIPDTMMKINRAFNGWQESGDIRRAFEDASPKFIKDALKTYRYFDEGVNTKRGDPIVAPDKLDAGDLIRQAIGFRPLDIATAQDRQRAQIGVEQVILRKRQRLINRYAMAVMADDEEAEAEADAAIDAWNDTKYGEQAPIKHKTLKRSIKKRESNLEKSEGGVLIENEDLGDLIREAIPAYE